MALYIINSFSSMTSKQKFDESEISREMEESDEYSDFSNFESEYFDTEDFQDFLDELEDHSASALSDYHLLSSEIIKEITHWVALRMISLQDLAYLI